MGKLHKNKNGFGAVEAILIVSVVLLIGGAGYMVYEHHNKPPDSSSSTGSTQAKTPSTQTAPAKKTTTKTVSLGTASYSFGLPDGWTFKEIPTEDVTNEKLVYIIDPTNKLQLEAQILSSAVTNGSVSTGLTSLKSFSGVDSKTYYIHGYSGDSTVTGAYEMLQISACSDKHCYTKINDGYSLSLAIRTADGATPTKVDNPIVNDIIPIIQSVKIGL